MNTMTQPTLTILITVFALSFFTLNAQAQSSSSIGGRLVYGTEIEQPGLQLHYYRAIPEALDNKIQVGGSFTYFFPQRYTVFGLEAKTQLISLGADSRFLFLESEAYTVYGLAGLNIMILGSDIEGVNGLSTLTSTSLGASFGGGGVFNIGFVQLNAELKYIANDFDQLEVSAGIQVPLKTR